MVCKKQTNEQKQMVEVEFEATFVVSKPVLLSTVLISLLFLSVHFMIPIHILGRKKKREKEWDFEV